MNELEQLKAIVQGEGFDNDSREAVAKIEASFKEVIASEKLAQHPVIKNYLDFLYSDVVSCKELLSSEHERLDGVARDRLFERIRQCKQTLRAFGGDRSDIEQHIKDMLEKAQRP